ncbi:MAG: U32 family peptidase [Clostridia bacterium]|nr:U32 family peptidase [Clostridia bacterium]
MKKVELLAPAGNYEKFEMALAFGADAVYLGGKNFSMRSAADNFSREDMKKAVDYAHSVKKKVFVTVNIIARNNDLDDIADEMRYINDIGADAIIISDVGLINMAKREAPDTPIHVSTQANILNKETAVFFAGLGISRLILARELSLDEIKGIRKALPDQVEIEVFVHGSMCISYSGRCLLSNYMANRDGNRGECAQPCRWNYSLVEEKRPGEYYPVYEDERGSYVFNSKDLCMIEHIPELIKAGINSFKIEGRMKSVFYTSMATRSYRKAIDAYYDSGGGQVFDPTWLEDLAKTSHRKYTTAFFFDEKPHDAQIYDTNMYIRTHSFVGKVIDYNQGTGVAKIMQRNPLFDGDEIEIIQPSGKDFFQFVKNMTDEDGGQVLSTPHAQMIYYMKMDKPVEPGALLMKKKAEEK